MGRRHRNSRVAGKSKSASAAIDGSEQREANEQPRAAGLAALVQLSERLSLVRAKALHLLGQN